MGSRVKRILLMLVTVTTTLSMLMFAPRSHAAVFSAAWLPPASPTNATSLTYTLMFSEWTSGIESYDFYNTGTARGCVFTPSASAGRSVKVVVSGCKEGTLIIRLSATSLIAIGGINVPAAVLDASLVTIDRTPPPAPVLIGAPSGYVNSSSQNISWSSVFDASGIARYECSPEGIAYSACMSPRLRSSLINGPHTLAVRSVDQAGNISQVSSANWIVDTALPLVTSFVRADAGGSYINSDSLAGVYYSLGFSEPVQASSVAVSSTVPTNGCVWAVKDADGKNIDNPVTTYISAYRVYVSRCNASPGVGIQPVLLLGAADRATNSINLPFRAADYFTYDSSMPTAVSLARGDAGRAYVNLISLRQVYYTLTFSEAVRASSIQTSTVADDTGCIWLLRQTNGMAPVNPNTTYATSYRLYPSECQTTTGTSLQPQLSPGFADQAGNTGSGPLSASSSVFYDTTLPAPSSFVRVDSGGPFVNLLGLPGVAYEIVFPEPVLASSVKVGSVITATRCAWVVKGADGKVFPSPATTYTTTYRTYVSGCLGSVGMPVKPQVLPGVVDRSSNINMSPVQSSVLFTYDTLAPPTPSLTSGPNAGIATKLTTATFAWSGDKDAVFQCAIDSAGWNGCNSPMNYSSLGIGVHLFRLRQADQAGNWSAVSSRNWSIIK